MTDLLKIARDRRAELQGEVARIEEFIDMAESLLRDHGQPAGPARDPRPAAVVHEIAGPLPAEPAADAPRGEDEDEADAAAETTEEPDDDADDEAVAVPAAAAAGSREASAGLTRINLLRRGPRTVTN